MKTDFLHKALKWISHNRNAFFAFAVVFLLCTIVGCGTFFQPKAPSPIDAKTLVTRDELDAIVAAFNLRAKAAYQAIDAQETFIGNLLDIGTTALQSLGGPLGTLAGGLGGSIATYLGVRRDARRKDQVISELISELKSGKRNPRAPG